MRNDPKCFFKDEFRPSLINVLSVVATCCDVRSPLTPWKCLTSLLPRGYSNHGDKQRFLREESLRETDAGSRPAITPSGGARWTERERERGVVRRLRCGPQRDQTLKRFSKCIKALRGCGVLPVWTHVSEWQIRGKFESDKEDCVSATRLRSRREHLKMRTDKSRLTDLTPTTLRDVLLAARLIFRIDRFPSAWRRDDTPVSIRNGTPRRAAALKRSLASANHLSANFYLGGGD